MKENDNDSNPSRVTKFIDKRMPISIPYTTPASEFLYGTSVVEAALKSKNVPRRQHYKLYIYKGEKRENVARDADIERLARRSGVEVARVGSDWLPLMDKMSGSRPHNGYILEASPLPRLPVTSLGELTEQDDRPGFKVAVDYQSREDAAVNGTSDFVRAKNNLGRKPLVLFLDSILDPGNLGGIIRTASFLGATAVAISKNCTAFSPVVLKASAGASENITLFTVNKPAGFIADSKLAGWKIFAAVAPSGSYMSSLISTDDLADPLSDDPCILMLGAEGEGLRMNLRSKADVQLSIRGNGQSHSVDSLNVSVATGILCSAFLKRSSLRKSAAPIGETSDVDEHDKGSRDLF
jgi:21S rRNA (GM2251-2'-O)-methyltransferase